MHLRVLIACLGSALLLNGCATAAPKASPGAVVSSAATTAIATSGAFHVEGKLDPVETVAGGVVRIEVTAHSLPEGEKLIGEFEGTSIPFYPLKEDGKFEGLLGIPHGRKPGDGVVKIRSFKAAAGATLAELKLKIGDAKFALEHLKVDGKHVNPPRKTMARITREIKLVTQAYASRREEKLWTGPFKLPIDSPMTSPFGTKRMYNGEERNFHGGLDLKAAVGTEIHAPQDGIVILAKDLYFTGNTVMLDHGYGVISLYAHMSKVRVKEGQRVKLGELLGLSGATGRVSGPHLHWTIYIHKIKVNPLTFMKVVR